MDDPFMSVARMGSRRAEDLVEGTHISMLSGELLVVVGKKQIIGRRVHVTTPIGKLLYLVDDEVEVCELGEWLLEEGEEAPPVRRSL